MSSTALYVQNLPTEAQRMLVLSHLVSLRAGDGWFQSAEVASLMLDLRIPALANPSATLGRLRAQGSVISRAVHGRTVWSLTPKGRTEAAAVLKGLDEGAFLAQLHAEAGAEAGALLGGTTHPTIPPELAPPRWSAGIARLLDKYPFERNVFCMTRFPDEDGELPDPVSSTIETARDTLAARGLHLHLASDGLLDDELFGNVGAYMWACRYGVGLLEDRAGEGLNYNVMTELGSMLITGRRCALLKDSTVPKLPTDLAGHVYKPVDFDNPKTVVAELNKWAADDLGL